MSESEAQEEVRERNPSFPQTHWTVIVAARQAGSKSAREALEELCRSYWYPLYAYVRRRGYSAEDAEDLTQSFYGHLLGSGLLQRVDPERGRFRSYLLVSMNRFLGKEKAKAAAQKRGSGQALLPLEGVGLERRYRLEPVCEETPERMFERRWALTVLDQALGRLRQEYAQRRKTNVFERLQKYLNQNAPCAQYRQEAVHLKTTPGAVGVAVHRLRQRYGEMIRREIARTVASQSEVDDEYRHLRSLLAGAALF